MGEFVASVKRAVWCVVGIGLLALSLAGLAQADHGKSALTEHDRTSIRNVIEKYRTSWLAGDAEGVMSTFTEDAVLLPAQGSAPVVGREAIRKYWWPAGAPPTTVTKLNITYEEMGGECGTAFK